MKIAEVVSRDINMDRIEDYNVIREFDGDIYRWDSRFVLRIGGEYYAPVTRKGDTLTVAKLNCFYPGAMKEFNDTEAPRCPLCGGVVAYSEVQSSYPHLCRNCGASVLIERVETVRYNTAVVSEPDVISLE